MSILERVPPKCFSCGKDIGILHENFQNLVSHGNTNAEAMDALGIDNYCCRTRFMCPGIISEGLAFDDTYFENTLNELNIKNKDRINFGSILFSLQGHKTEIDKEIVIPLSEISL